MIRKLLVWLYMACSLFLSTGCWNHQELDELAIVMAMGIDKGEQKKYRISYQVVNPGEMVQQAPNRASPITTYEAEGDTLDEAAQNVSQKLSREIFFAHIHALVIGEEVAREGIEDLFDVVERDPEGRINFPTFVARDTKAVNVISTLSPLEKISGIDLFKKQKITEQTSALALDSSINDVINALHSAGREPTICGMRVAGDPKEAGKQENNQMTQTPSQLTINGLAIFKNGKLVGYFDGPMARGLAFIRDKVKMTVVNEKCGNKRVSIQITDSNTKLSVDMKQNKPEFTIDIRSEGVLQEVTCRGMDLNNPQTIERLQKKANETIKQEVEAAFSAAQRAKADVLGLGETLHQQKSEVWKQYQSIWPGYFPKVKVKIDVKTFIRSPGMRSNSYK
ncbi:Ger(x)C family spore germination protein [Paenactinomyces guangxiensis]|uniref:Ger(X)C family spore germination protein n=1 Tax=Paenactinomyces guangxiensis TaxID=1490290 RepID=A0A7W1WRJ6_9BACL|nr:Ger(x)C family spore germination protein [Paenactinomyces guangxiensis]MBA4494769.1 Ger(x)C family spore germination protein [Paenactinomyces guangxiensis]MBH8591853.1 Ger(x)C family spore germination protein [Paenactinomyces guangxiensis]